MKFYLLIAVYLNCALASLSFDLSIGNAYSFDQNISIEMKHEHNINFKASPKTNGFKNPLYYSLRVKKRINDFDIELELIHHKIYISKDKLPASIQKFEVSDGYNLVLINYRKKINHLIGYRTGIGAVVAHPDIMINGKTNFVRGGGAIPKFWSDGYYWSGYSIQGSIFIERKFTKKLHYNVELKGTHSRAKIPVEGGILNLPNTSIHILLGISY